MDELADAQADTNLLDFRMTDWIAGTIPDPNS